MAIDPGTYEAGPSTGRLLLRTFRQGVAARAGHDLVLEAGAWAAQIVVPAGSDDQASVQADVDLRELRVREGTGGVKPLSEADKDDIYRTMQQQLGVDRHPSARFASSSVEGQGDTARIDGTLDLAGQRQALQLLAREQPGGTVVVTASIVQSRWGIKPYSGFLGALKLRDAVDLEVTVRLGAA